MDPKGLIDFFRLEGYKKRRRNISATELKGEEAIRYIHPRYL